MPLGLGFFAAALLLLLLLGLLLSFACILFVAAVVGLGTHAFVVSLVVGFGADIAAIAGGADVDCVASSASSVANVASVARVANAAAVVARRRQHCLSLPLLVLVRLLATHLVYHFLFVHCVILVNRYPCCYFA